VVSASGVEPQRERPSWVHSAVPSNRSRNAGSGSVNKHIVAAFPFARSVTSVDQSWADVLSCRELGNFIEPVILVVVGVKL
jgi:hypothetical protein